MFTRTEYGFWKQDDPKPFTYTPEYAGSQSTTEAMAFLRLGWVSALLPDDYLREASVVDVGAGNRAVEKFLGSHVGRVASYDVAGDSISREELRGTSWDLALFCDVIEHVPDLGFLWDIPWKYAYVSFPETPPVRTWRDLRSWRHFKPDEHVWMLNLSGMTQFVSGRAGGQVLGAGHAEDLIRTRWDPVFPNISSMLIRR